MFSEASWSADTETDLLWMMQVFDQSLGPSSQAAGRTSGKYFNSASPRQAQFCIKFCSLPCTSPTVSSNLISGHASALPIFPA